jgi:hypothetical protein
MSINKNQFITEVIIRGFTYELWELNDREPHSLGTMNGESGKLWVKQIGDGPFKDAPGEDEWIPWLDYIANRDCWEIHIKDGNSIKYNSFEYSITKHTTAFIKLNGNDIYQVDGNDFDFCYNIARTKIYQLKELLYTFDINLKEISYESGRKIFYKGMPAVIYQIYIDGNMYIKADYSEVDKDIWWNEMIEPWYDDYSIQDLDECKSDNGIKVDILSKDIYWNRNDRQIKLNKIKRNTNVKGTP